MTQLDTPANLPQSSSSPIPPATAGIAAHDATNPAKDTAPTLPPVTGATTQIPLDPHQVTGFHSKTVIVYSSENGNQGEKVMTSAISLPLQVRTQSADGTRLGFMTVDGLKWIARSEVLQGAQPLSAASANQR